MANAVSSVQVRNAVRSTADSLDQVQMAREERELAKKQLRSIERTLDALWSLFGQKPQRGVKFRTPATA